MSECKGLNLELNPTQWARISNSFAVVWMVLQSIGLQLKKHNSVKFKVVYSHDINKINDTKFFTISIKKKQIKLN